MPSPGSNARVHAELVGLIEAQLKTLEKETFGGVTKTELSEYETRGKRIRKLYAELINNREAAA